MVAPTLNTTEKKAEKSPGLVTVVVTPEEAPPIKVDGVYPAAEAQLTPIRYHKKRRCCICCVAMLTFFSALLVCGGIWLSTGRSAYWMCGVRYDDYEYGRYYDTYSSDYKAFDSYDYEGHPYGDDGLFAPNEEPPMRPIHRILNEGISISVELNIVRITKPADEMTDHVDIIHDFSSNMSVFHLPSSDICYLAPLDTSSVVHPQTLQSYLERDTYLNQRFPMNRQVYGAIPEPMENLGDLNSEFDQLCGMIPTYQIQQIQAEHVPRFWTTVRGIIGRDRSSEEEGHRPGHGRHGGRHHDQEPQGEDEEWGIPGMRKRRGILDSDISRYVDSIRSFGGQSIMKMHVFKTQDMEDMSIDIRNKLAPYITKLDMKMPVGV